MTTKTKDKAPDINDLEDSKKDRKTNTEASAQQQQTLGDKFQDTNFFMYSGPILSDSADKWRDFLNKTAFPKEKAVVLFCTCGGDPDEAFRMMRLLQYRYHNIEVVIFGQCYSAGTIFAMGANKIYMTDNAQLGPLDVQIRKEDDLMRMSGECYRQALRNMSLMAECMFIENLVGIKANQQIPISTATASRSAAEITIGLLSPITSQIEPSKLGEVLRAQSIGASYGVRLMQNNYSPERAQTIVNKLAGGYPSHSTVIDFYEAKKIGLAVEFMQPNKNFDGELLQFESLLLVQSNAPQFQLLDDTPLKKLDKPDIL